MMVSPVMAADETDETVQDGVWRWRIAEFRRLGFSRHQQKALADREVSPHDAAVLVGNGCPVDVAFDILS